MEIHYESEVITKTPSFGGHEEYEADIQVTNIINDARVMQPSDIWEICDSVAVQFIRVYADNPITVTLDENIVIPVTRYLVLHDSFASVTITAPDTEEGGLVITPTVKVIIGYSAAA